MKKSIHTHKKYVLFLLSLTGILILWELACARAWISPILLSPPSEIAEALQEKLLSGFWNKDLWTTGKAYGSSLLLALLIGVPLGLAMGLSKSIFHLVNPYVITMNALPKIILCPLVMMWLGTGMNARVFLGTLMASFPIITATLTGIQSIDRGYIELAKIYQSSKAKTLKDIILPSLSPYILSGLRVGVNYAMVGVLIIEFFASSQGVGYRMYAYSQNFSINYFFALLLITVSFVLLCSSLVYSLERRLGGWRDAAFK